MNAFVELGLYALGSWSVGYAGGYLVYITRKFAENIV